ncbi:hypothetical protein [Celeribacter sp.]|uniref:hypothetical protein n=1 Tax=Celeribacter sp. TaxID=1890673 RepID=UPI003A8E4AF8
MPLLSIAIEHDVWQARGQDLMSALPAMRAMLCEKLDVGQEFSHLSVNPVFCPKDQTLVSADLRVLGKEGRGADLLNEVAGELQAMISSACKHHASVRITTMDPAKYFTRR